MWQGEHYLHGVDQVIGTGQSRYFTIISYESSAHLTIILSMVPRRNPKMSLSLSPSRVALSIWHQSVYTLFLLTHPPFDLASSPKVKFTVNLTAAQYYYCITVDKYYCV